MFKSIFFINIFFSSLYILVIGISQIEIKIVNIFSVLSVIYIIFFYLIRDYRFNYSIKNIKLFLIVLLILFFLYPYSIYISPIKFSSFLLYASLILSLLIIPILLFSWRVINFSNDQTNYFIKILKFNFYFPIIVILIEFILSISTSYQASQPGAGWFGLDRPGGFFGDCNFSTIWITVICLLLMILNKNKNPIKNLNFIFIICLFINIILQTRLTLFIIILAPFIIFHKEILGRFWWINYLYLILFFIFSIKITLDSNMLPERFTYDFVNTSRNPRLNDANMILSELFADNLEFFGRGLGTTIELTDRYKWRKFNKVINVGPVYILQDFGYFGAFLFFLLILFFYQKIYYRDIKKVFLIMVICNIFHFHFYFPWFWTLISLLIISDNIIKKHNSIDC
tara:strand:+ start:2004 stop:3197 length:1194 start_codon:yes stop_codon:yes gene_type:complete